MQNIPGGVLGLINPKGRNLYRCITDNHYKTLSGGKPTYWPTDPKKIPDLLDFAVYSGICSNSLDIINDDNLPSDHTPILINYSTQVELSSANVKLITSKTNLNFYGEWVDKNIDLKTSIKTGEELDDTVESFTSLIHEAAVLSTPEIEAPLHPGHKVQSSAYIRQFIKYKRSLRRIWKRTRNPSDKTKWNLACKSCTELLEKERSDNTSQYLQKLSPRKPNQEDYIFNATKYLKKPANRNVPIKNVSGSWCRTDVEKAIVFSEHLEQTFQPHDTTVDDNDVQSFLDAPCQLEFPIRHITPSEVKEEIRNLNTKKSTGYDKIDAKAIQSLPNKALIFLTLIYNSILRLQHFPTQWKCAEIIMVAKPNKPENMVSSYRPISLLTIFSKIFERLFLKRLTPVLNRNNIIPEYQFGFRQHHGTPEQCHRIIKVISASFERKMYCSAVFLDIQQAFDKVWHEGLLYKLKKLLPAPFYLFLKSYLKGRSFYVKINNETSDIKYIAAGVPQGSVLAPVLYTIFTYDMPIIDEVTVATYADDTAFICTSNVATEASRVLQTQLNNVNVWLKKWKIRVNAQKSSHITFTLRRDSCSPVYLNESEIPIKSDVKYLGLHLDRRLTWKTHVKAKRTQLNNKFKKMYWLLGRKSQLSLENKLLLYKTILKPIWTYGIELWGTTSNSNVEILQRFQSKALRSIVNAPWFITNKMLHTDLNVPFIKPEISRLSNNYLERLSNHVNPLAISLLDDSEEIRRLKRNHILDLPFRH